MKEVKLLIVEDEPLIARDIKKCCLSIGYQVLAIASRSDRALDLLHSQTPDAVILDISIKGSLDGIQLAEIINEKYNLPFIFLTSHADRGTLNRAKNTMPYGYILKPFDENDLMTALEIAIHKHQSLAPVKEGFPSREAIIKSHDLKVSEREYAIMESIYQGMTNQEMANKFFVSPNTIKSHIKRIYVKMSVHSRAEMIKVLLA